MPKKIIIAIILVCIIIAIIRVYTIMKPINDKAVEETNNLISTAQSAAERTKIMKVQDERMIELDRNKCITWNNKDSELSENVIVFDFSSISNYKGITIPEGDTVDYESFEYTVDQNGEYQFTILYDDDINVERTITIENIK